MAYIKFKLSRISDKKGNTTRSVLSRIGSDMEQLNNIQPNFIYHAIANIQEVNMFLELDEGLLDRDMLMGAEYLYLDKGILDCDYLI